MCLGIVIIRTTRACLATTRALVRERPVGAASSSTTLSSPWHRYQQAETDAKQGDYQKNGSEDMEKVEPPCATDGNVQVQVQLLWETAWQVLKVTLRITV